MTLRQATEEDLPFIAALERKFCDLGFVGADSLETHRARLADEDCSYSIVESGGGPAGFVILRGLSSRNRSIELKRIVIGEPGQGLGRRALEATIADVFGRLSAHRLWLDVFEHNTRARHVYRSLGFQEEGMLRESIFHNGRYDSLVLMSILEQEYRARSEATRLAAAARYQGRG